MPDFPHQPLFGPRANAKVRWLFAGAAFVAVSAGASWYAFPRSDWNTGIDNTPEQPIQFSHEHHVDQLGIDCRYCHSSVESSPTAGLPATEVCMTCHSQLFTDSPMLEPVRRSWLNDEPIVWKRVHNLADYVYFNHAAHVNKGVSCVQCHGRVDRMPAVSKAHSLHMRWCLECHEHPGPRLSPPGETYDLAAAIEPVAENTSRELLQSYRVQTRGLTDCATCHH